MEDDDSPRDEGMERVLRIVDERRTRVRQIEIKLERAKEVDRGVGGFPRAGEAIRFIRSNINLATRGIEVAKLEKELHSAKVELERAIERLSEGVLDE